MLPKDSTGLNSQNCEGWYQVLRPLIQLSLDGRVIVSGLALRREVS